MESCEVCRDGDCRILVQLGVSTVDSMARDSLRILMKQLSLILACVQTFIQVVLVHIHFIWGRQGAYMNLGEWEGVSRVLVKSLAVV